MNAKLLPLILLLLLVGSTGLQAQNWDQLGPLLELFDQDERNNFENELDGLRDRLLYDSGDGLQVSDLDSGPSIDSLLQYLSGGGIGVPDSLIDVWNGNRGDLDMLLNTGLFSTEDSLALIDQFGVVNGEWYNELDSLQNVITNDFPDVSGSLFNNGDNRFGASGGNWEFAFNCLNDGSLDFRNGITPQGVDSLIEVMDTSLFAGNMDIEIAFGQEWSQVGFYNESYSARSSMIRVASVPTYRETMSYRWALEGSFFTVSDDILSETNANLVENLNPFICNANVAMMYLPYFGDIGRGAGEFRFYTSIGMDLSTYVPAHVNASNARTLDNVGKTTGYGPEIGAGFVVNVGAMSMYSYGTVATGDVVDAPDDYRYNAMTANAGVRFGDAINAKYTLGRASWAPGDRKTATYSRFSVGLILDSLNR